MKLTYVFINVMGFLVMGWRGMDGVHWGSVDGVDWGSVNGMDWGRVVCWGSIVHRGLVVHTLLVMHDVLVGHRRGMVQETSLARRQQTAYDYDLTQKMISGQVPKNLKVSIHEQHKLI